MYARFPWPKWRPVALIGLLFLLAVSPMVAQEPDPAYDRYVNLDLLATAREQKNPELLTDIGLQLMEGERVLLRSHKAISSDHVLAMAVKVAGERKDAEALKRLAAIFETTKKAELAAEVARAQKLAWVSRAVDPALIIQVDQVSPATFLVMQSLIEEITAAKMAGDGEALDTILKHTADVRSLSEAQRKSLVKMASE